MASMNGTHSWSVKPSLREEIVELFSLFAKSLDDGDADLLHTVLTEDMVMDLTAFESIGMTIPVLRGRDTVISTLMRSVGQTQDSTHQLTNFIISLNSGAAADVECYALVQHYRLGQGLSRDLNKDYYLMGNRYQASVVRDGDAQVWKIQKMTVRAQWVQGNVEVMKAH